MSPGWRGHDLEEAHHRRDYATVALAVGGGQPRGDAVWGCRTRMSGACGTGGTNATRGGQLARYRRLFQRLQHAQPDGGACGGGQLRASAQAVGGQVLWNKTS